MNRKKCGKRPATPKIQEQQHGRYLIKAGMLGDTIVARAFPKPPSKFRHLVAEATGETAKNAIEQLIVKLEALRSERRSSRRTDPALASGVPTSDEYADAMRSLSPGPNVLGVLHDHALMRRRGIPLSELAQAFSSIQDLLNVYEKLGTEILRVIEPDETLENGLSVVINLPTDRELAHDDLVTLQPELQDALLQLLGSTPRS